MLKAQTKAPEVPEVDLEGLDDIEPVVIDAIRKGAAMTEDRNIHPRFEDTAENIERQKAAAHAVRAADGSWLVRLKKKMFEAKKRDPNNYTLY